MQVVLIRSQVILIYVVSVAGDSMTYKLYICITYLMNGEEERSILSLSELLTLKCDPKI